MRPLAVESRRLIVLLGVVVCLAQTSTKLAVMAQQMMMNGTVATVPTPPYDLQQCVDGLLALGLDLSDYDSYPVYFDDESSLILAEVGTFVGVKNIEEYVRFAFLDSDYVGKIVFSETEKPISKLKSFDPETGICTFLDLRAPSEYTMNPMTTSGNVFWFANMFTTSYSLPLNKITNMDVYYTKEFMEFFFSQVLAGDPTNRFVCESMRDYCPAVYEQNGNRTIEECMDQLAALPEVSEGIYMDGNDQACRKIHTIMARVNKDHCPHLSFVPIEDVSGKIKCQTSEQLQVSDLFDATDLAMFTDFVTSNTSILGTPSAYRVFSGNGDGTNGGDTTTSAARNNKVFLSRIFFFFAGTMLLPCSFFFY